MPLGRGSLLLVLGRGTVGTGGRPIIADPSLGQGEITIIEPEKFDEILLAPLTVADNDDVIVSGAIDEQIFVGISGRAVVRVVARRAKV